MGFLSGILGFLGGAALSAIESFVIFLFNLIVQVFSVLYQLITIVGNFLMGIFANVAKFFTHLWNGFFKGIFSSVWNVIKQAQAWLEARLRPIINFLKRVRAIYDQIYARYLRPILVLLQHVRQFLQLLTLLHVKFAAELDAKLAQIENKIAQTFLTFRAALNNAIDLLNLMADPTLLLRKPTLLLSIRRQLPALIRAVTGKPAGWYFPAPKGAPASAYAPISSTYLPTGNPLIPSVSSYMGSDDGIEHVGAIDMSDPTYTIHVDVVDVLPYFNDDLYPSPTCSDPAQCLNSALQLLLPPVTNG